jgi:hypothetical protein
MIIRVRRLRLQRSRKRNGPLCSINPRTERFIPPPSDFPIGPNQLGCRCARLGREEPGGS